MGWGQLFASPLWCQQQQTEGSTNCNKTSFLSFSLCFFENNLIRKEGKKESFFAANLGEGRGVFGQVGWGEREASLLILLLLFLSHKKG